MINLLIEIANAKMKRVLFRILFNAIVFGLFGTPIKNISLLLVTAVN